MLGLGLACPTGQPAHRVHGASGFLAGTPLAMPQPPSRGLYGPVVANGPGCSPRCGRRGHGAHRSHPCSVTPCTTSQSKSNVACRRYRAGNSPRSAPAPLLPARGILGGIHRDPLRSIEMCTDHLRRDRSECVRHDALDPTAQSGWCPCGGTGRTSWVPSVLAGEVSALSTRRGRPGTALRVRCRLVAPGCAAGCCRPCGGCPWLRASPPPPAVGCR